VFTLPATSTHSRRPTYALCRTASSHADAQAPQRLLVVHASKERSRVARAHLASSVARCRPGYPTYVLCRTASSHAGTNAIQRLLAVHETTDLVIPRTASTRLLVRRLVPVIQRTCSAAQRHRTQTPRLHNDYWSYTQGRNRSRAVRAHLATSVARCRPGYPTYVLCRTASSHADAQATQRLLAVHEKTDLVIPRTASTRHLGRRLMPVIPRTCSAAQRHRTRVPTLSNGCWPYTREGTVLATHVLTSPPRSHDVGHGHTTAASRTRGKESFSRRTASTRLLVRRLSAMVIQRLRRKGRVSDVSTHSGHIPE